ncbi:unnamed protein product [Trichobilharzia regenti]|nr:unnamed protein product [Trichobilharzia regenti]
MNSSEHHLQIIKLTPSKTCKWTLKTLHDLPSSYISNNDEHRITSDNALTNSSNESLHYVWFTWTTIVPIVIVICTILGNSLICFVALIDRHLRHRSNVFFISLSLTNILFSCSVMTFSIMYNLIQPEKFSDDLVKIFLSLDKLFCTATILHLVVMAFDRFLHIKAPLKYSRRLKLRFLFTILSGLWFLSILIAILPIQLNWHTPNYTECTRTSTTDSASNTRTFEHGGDKLTDAIKENCTKHPFYSSATVETVAPSNDASVAHPFFTPETDISCIHQIDCFYALTNATFSFVIPLTLMVIIYTRLFLLTKQHISRLNFYPNSSNCSRDLSSCENTNGKHQHQQQQILNTSHTSPNIMFQRKSLSSTRNMFLDPNYDSTSILRSSLTVSSDVYKLRPRLSRSHLGASLRSVQITPRNGCFSVVNKSLAVHYKTSTSSFSSLEQSSRRKYSLPGLCIPFNKSSNVYANAMTTLSRPQIQLNTSDKQIHKAHKAAITLGVILGSFTVCWLPYFSINCMASFCNCIPSEFIIEVIIIIII